MTTILLTLVVLSTTGHAVSDTVRVELPGLDHAFLIDDAEVTVDRYKAWDPSYDPDYADGNHPANGISFDHAKAYCASKGMRLPTSEEWRRACSGRKQFLFSVTAEYDSSAARVGVRTWSDGPAAVRSYPPNDLGLYDMVGNVWEWVTKDGRPYLQGGSWVDRKSRANCSKRIRVTGGKPAANYGFRCAR